MKDLATAIVPLFTLGKAGDTEARDFLGTGYVFPGGLLLTCWHVVRGAVEAGLTVVAVVEIGADSDGAQSYMPHVLRELEQDALGRDLASARVDLIPRVSLGLAPTRLDFGASVVTYGYPLTERPTERRPTFMLAPRYLEGYVTRVFRDEDRGYGETPAYELVMPAPAGLSGAPLFEMGTTLDVVGMVYGVHEAHTIRWEEESIEGVRSEVRSIVSFSLAHLGETLAAHRSTATGDRPLGELVRSLRDDS